MSDNVGHFSNIFCLLIFNAFSVILWQNRYFPTFNSVRKCLIASDNVGNCRKMSENIEVACGGPLLVPGAVLISDQPSRVLLRMLYVPFGSLGYAGFCYAFLCCINILGDTADLLVQ